MHEMDDTHGVHDVDDASDVRDMHGAHGAHGAIGTPDAHHLHDIRDAGADDAAAIAAIYNHYVLGSTISFEEEAVPASAMAQRIAEVQGASLPWLVIECAGTVAGYAYATKWRVRHAYRHSVETTVYLAPGHTGAGLGTRLYGALFERLRKSGYHLAIGGIALPNPASIALHEKAGFEKAAHFEEVGFKSGRWIDVGYWQLKLGPATLP